MKKEYITVLLCLSVCFPFLVSIPSCTVRESPCELVWSDEFDGGQINPTKWTYDLGNGFYAGDTWIDGWGNNELEYYTDGSDNVWLENGVLGITARRQTVLKDSRSYPYTSARLKTKGLFSCTYGKIEARIRLPGGKGLWPAFWMLPDTESYGGWAASGEIDIMEAHGSDPSGVSCALHYGGKWPNNTYSSFGYSFPSNQSILDFHVYGLEWTSTEMKWYVDDNYYATAESWYSLSPGKQEQNPYPAPFDLPFHIILNLAVGGNFDGNPDESVNFPQTMEIDYVRVYR